MTVAHIRPHASGAQKSATRNFAAAFGTLLVLPLLVALATTTTPASAQGFKVVYMFCENRLCPDGYSPSDLAADTAGNLFGTTRGGGPSGGGTIFELKHRANGRYKFEQLYGFCSEMNCLDGQLPGGRPVVDVSGNLYGTALGGGTSGYNGVVWELKRSHGVWKLKVLHNFCPPEGDCSDGVEPMASLTYASAVTGALYDGKSPLYGVTPFGGAGFQGVVFQLTPDKSGWDFQVLYTFCPGGNCGGGAVPNGPLLPDAAGNLYGMTYGGGSASRGAVFELSQSGGNWSESALYSFCQQADCVDGEQPSGGLAMDGTGVLFGTASAGGNFCSGNNIGCGVLFKLAPNGGQWQQTVLHSFCSESNCADGATPAAAPFIDTNGDLIGTAQFGGNADSKGVVWRFSGGNFEAMHKFCRKSDCPDGANPAAAVISDGAGHLIGTTAYGGPNNGGSVYEIAP